MITNTKTTLRRCLSLLVLILVGYLTFSCNSDKKVEEELEAEKQIVLNELEEMSAAYEVAISESKEKDTNLEEAKFKIEALIDSLKIAEPSVKALLQLKGRQLELNSEMKNLIRENKELKQDNEILVYSLTKRKGQLSKSEALNDSLTKEKEGLVEKTEALNNKINEANFLNLLDLTVEGIKVKSSGKEIITDRTGRVDKFKVCYKIAKNTLVEESNKTLYVQILDPNNSVVTSNKAASKMEDNEIEYSFSTSFKYKKENLTVCDYLVINEDKDLVDGTYTINVFDGMTLVTSSTLSLR
jgi:hypothetical protein